MLETLDLSASLAADEYQARKEEIQTELHRAQREAKEAGLSVIVIFEGWDFSGKGQCVRYLTEPMDPRGHKVHVMYPPTVQERDYPFGRRYWLRLPARGHFAFFIRSWYYHVLDERVEGGEGALESAAAFDEIRTFEHMLTDDGGLIVKFWLHISKREQNRRKKAIKKSLARRWRVGADDPKQPKRRKEYERAVEEMLAATSTDFARWYPIAAEDRRYARVAVATRLVNRIKDAVAVRRAEQSASVAAGPLSVAHVAEPADLSAGVLKKLDLAQRLAEPEYKSRLKAAQTGLAKVHYECVDRRRPAIVVFEGWDAAGKGGAIRRLTTELDPRYFNVYSIAAPRGDEADHHYLWRFWRAVPAAGEWAIFDRSWYGRVLVERVEGFATVPQWRRAYREINDFEAALYESGAILVKFWLHISSEEQLRRFQERQEVEYKSFKITDEDWRNRGKWPEYERAVEDMVQRTSTPVAPWTVVPANDKRAARMTILEACLAQLEEGLGRTVSRLRRSL